MKVLLLVPKAYSISEMLYDGFKENGLRAYIFDYRHETTPFTKRLYEKTTGLPQRFTGYWKQIYYNTINKKYLQVFNEVKPDLVLIYNNQLVFPETLIKMKKRSKIVFFLGDNPLWSKSFEYNLEILMHADLVLSPDSHWQFELSMIGVPNIVCDHIGYSKNRFFTKSNIPNDLRDKYKSDLLFIGRNYRGSTGYKRTQFLSSFAGMNLKVFGNGNWFDWLDKFPELKNHFCQLEKRISHEELNMAINCAKIYPVDQNTGIVNGVHLRVFETIGAGALPLVEWRHDLDDVFNGILPVIKNYHEAKKLAERYLDSEDKRVEIIKALNQHLSSTYTPTLYVERILERLGLLRKYK